MTPDERSADLTRLRAYLASRFSATVQEISTVDVAIALLEHLWRIEHLQTVALRTCFIADQVAQCATNTNALQADVCDDGEGSLKGLHV